MDAPHAKKKIAELRREIEAHDRRYYVEAKPTISDAAYDELDRELRELEAARPEPGPHEPPHETEGGERAAWAPARRSFGQAGPHLHAWRTTTSSPAIATPAIVAAMGAPRVRACTCGRRSLAPR